MKISELGFDNFHELDHILVELCQLVIRGQKKDSDYYGMVAACVLDPNGQRIYGINSLESHNQRIHAERAAIDNYKSQYGDIPKDSIIITTCSPCSEDMEDRYGDSCTDLINDCKIKMVYCGYLDPTQIQGAAYKRKQFEVQETKNEDIRELCEKFASTFLSKEV